MFMSGEHSLERMILATACSLSLQEVQNCLVGNLGLVREEKMTGVWNEHKLSAGNAICDQLSVARGHETIVLTMDHESGHGDRRQTAVTFPGKDSLQLGDVGFRPRQPGPSNGQVFFDPLA